MNHLLGKSRPVSKDHAATDNIHFAEPGFYSFQMHLTSTNKEISSRAICDLHRQLIAVIDRFQSILRFIQPVGLRNAISNSSQSIILHGGDGLYVNMLSIEFQILLQRIHTVLFGDVMDAHI